VRLPAARGLADTRHLCHSHPMDEQPRYRWPWLFLFIFLFGCLLAALWLLAEVKRTRHVRDLNNPSVTQIQRSPNSLAILTAVKTYTRELKSRGQSIPAWVTVRELTDRRLLRAEEVGDFGGAEVFISLTAADETKPSQVLMEARFNDGTKIVVLADGSVQQRR
jgi:hypothetical protein